MPYSKKDLKYHIRECKHTIRLLNKFYKYPNGCSVFKKPLYEVIEEYEQKLDFYKRKLVEAE